MKQSNNKIQEISDTIKGCMKFTFKLLIGFINLFITLIILIGSVTSVILLYKLYPETFVELMITILPLTNLLTQLFNIILGVFMGLVIGYLLVYLIISTDNSVKKLRERNIERRKQFINDLAKEIKENIKNKK